MVYISEFAVILWNFRGFRNSAAPRCCLMILCHLLVLIASGKRTRQGGPGDDILNDLNNRIMTPYNASALCTSNCEASILPTSAAPLAVRLLLLIKATIDSSHDAARSCFSCTS